MQNEGFDNFNLQPDRYVQNGDKFYIKVENA